MNGRMKQTNIEPRKQSQMVVRTTTALESIDSNHVFFVLYTSVPSSIVAQLIVHNTLANGKQLSGRNRMSAYT